MAFGTAISSLITQSVTALSQVYLAIRFVNINLNKSLLFRTILFALLFFSFTKLLLWLPVDLFIWYKFLIAIVVGLALALKLGLLNISSALALLSNKAAD